jgi:selenocysteine lyase/cysteine desulfurase
MTAILDRGSDAETCGEAERLFRASFPDYGETALLDELRRADFARLDRQRHVYLDFTGGGLYSDTQVREHMQLLQESVLGNPHSSNPTSALATSFVDQTRRSILAFFNADASEYEVVLTQNATGALKLVGEAYPFGAGSRLLLAFDNHNSVLGIREFARAAGAEVIYAPLLLPEMRIDAAFMSAALRARPDAANKLLAFPAQSNFSGVQHSLDWIADAQQSGWDVLLDAASFAPTNSLDLARIKPDFVAISFYKIFGYPTGTGCLIAKKTALSKLRRPWFSGGTIAVASVRNDRHRMQEGAEAFEDGTVNYLAAPAVEIGLRYVAKIGYPLIHARVEMLTGWLLGQLSAMRHGNGLPVVRIYGPVTNASRGGTVALNFFDADGAFIDHRLVEARANEAGISLRTGSFCNPGGGESALGLFDRELSECSPQSPSSPTMDDFRMIIGEQSTGAVRISLGLVSNFADVHAFVCFASRLVDKRVGEI